MDKSSHSYLRYESSLTWSVSQMINEICEYFKTNLFLLCDLGFCGKTSYNCSRSCHGKLHIQGIWVTKEVLLRWFLCSQADYKIKFLFQLIIKICYQLISC